MYHAFMQNYYIKKKKGLKAIRTGAGFGSGTETRLTLPQTTV